jgi:pimeloyl-ACP methyl ester carboxylesterase
VLALLLCACGPGFDSQPAGERTIGGESVRVEEIRFRSGGFGLVGDLRLPVEGELHAAVIMVHGDGPVTRDGYPTTYRPVMEIFLRHGYAVFSWDKPGSGDSTGTLMDKIPERAGILTRAIEVLTDHPAIDPNRIGLWGISQAGWVMPLALEDTDQVAFMVVVGGGGEDSIEQFGYLVGRLVACEGGSEEEATRADDAWVQAGKAQSYADYRDATQILLSEPAVESFTGLQLAGEDGWKPRPTDSLAFLTGTEIMENTSLPVLVFFGERDKNVDPVAGVAAWDAALQKAGNPHSRAMLIPGVAHTLVEAETGCLNESWGLTPAPEYLETLEEWLQQLPG